MECLERVPWAQGVCIVRSYQVLVIRSLGDMVLYIRVERLDDTKRAREKISCEELYYVVSQTHWAISSSTQ
jgi:hypothetical protein